MSTASRSDWFAHCERRVDSRDIPGLGKVYLRSMTFGEAAEAIERSAVVDASGKVTHDTRYVFADRAIATVIDEHGEEMFGELDREKLAAMDQGMVAPLHEFIMEHCGLGKYRVDFSQLKKTSDTTTTSSMS